MYLLCHFLIVQQLNCCHADFARPSLAPIFVWGQKKDSTKNGCPDGRRYTRLLPVGTPTFRQLQPSRTCVLYTLYHPADKMSMPEGQKPLFLHILQKSGGIPLVFCLHPICPILPCVMKPSRPAGHITRRSLISRPTGHITRQSLISRPAGHITRRSLISLPKGISRGRASYHSRREYHEAEPHITPHRAYHEAEPHITPEGNITNSARNLYHCVFLSKNAQTATPC